METYLGVTTAITALGMVVLGAATPALFTGISLPGLIALLVLVALPVVLLGGYLVPRWLTRPKPWRCGAAWSRFSVRSPGCWACFFRPARPEAPPTSATIWRQGAASGLAQ